MEEREKKKSIHYRDQKENDNDDMALLRLEKKQHLRKSVSSASKHPKPSSC